MFLDEVNKGGQKYRFELLEMEEGETLGFYSYSSQITMLPSFCSRNHIDIRNRSFGWPQGRRRF